MRDEGICLSAPVATLRPPADERAALLARFSHRANECAPGLDLLLSDLAEEVGGLLGGACAIDLFADGDRWVSPPAAEGADRQVVTAALLVREQTLGIITIARLAGRPAYNDDDRAFVVELADRAAAAVDNARLSAARLSAEESLRQSDDRLGVALATAKARARQQAAVAELGRQALSRMDLDSLMAVAVKAVVDCLGDEFAKVLEVLPGGEELLLRAGEGWHAGLVGTARVPAGRGSHAGYTLLAGHPVVVEDLRKEDRFTAPALMVDHDVVSAASVIITLEGEPYGVLSTHSTRPRRFTGDEVNFLQSVANVLAVAMVRLRNDELKERAAAQDRLAALGRLAAGVAHDFNNIVTVISVCAQLLESQAGLDDEGREQVGHIRRQTETAASMVWQVLDFAQRGAINRALVDLDAFFVDLLPVLARTVRPKVALGFEGDGAPHAVLGDTSRLEQILCNLVVNAGDAIADAGRIDVTLTRHDVHSEALAPAAGITPGPWVRITVADTGAGIAPDVLPRIFEPFFSTKAPGHGTGLGLAQVYGLVAQHDGHVHASSIPGDGTTIEIWIPAASAG
jgi:signal transduction histidine kinase